jgi:hypothetical protein
LDDCRQPLTNYKDGIFCEEHLHLRNICGIIPCGEPVQFQGAKTCANPSHIDWHKKWMNHFKRLSYPGVRRVIRRQHIAAEEAIEGGVPNRDVTAPALHVRMPPLQGIPGENVTHMFRAGTIYCIMTIQWSCGYPLGWGKCYKSESAPQVLEIMNKMWAVNAASRPSFMAYDDACDLLRHIVTQDPHSEWLKTTKFIVDAWHYIGHRATDVLCRLWCNPAPTNGSQPDLVLTEQDANGQTHTTRAFNTETAEQLNSWLNGFEAQLSQMTDVNFDFFMHVLFLLFKETMEEQIAKKERELPDEF